MRALAGLVAAIGLCFSLSSGTAIGVASPPRPANLEVVGGEGWRAENGFSLSWTSPPLVTPALSATRYRLRDPQGATVDQGHLGWIGDGIGALTVPNGPGAYDVEVWFEDTVGEAGPAARAKLRFDNARPGQVVPEQLPGWVGRPNLPLRVRLSHPAGPAPLAGIHGYAVAIDGRPNSVPCGAGDRCSTTETTLHGGPGDDVVELTALPEGTSYLHAVAVSGSGMKSADAGTASLRVDTTDPVTHLYGAPAGWTNRVVRLHATAQDSAAGMQADGSGPAPFTAIEIDGSAPAIGAGDSVAAEVLAEGRHRISYYARDAAGNVNDGARRNGVAGRVPGTAMVGIDRTPPLVAFANAQDPGDPDVIRVRVADSLAGADLARGVIGVRAVGSGDRFDPLPMLPPAGGELRARWASDERSRGRYEFKAIGYDAAGNETVATRRRNGSPMVLSNPLKATTRLSASFHRRTTTRAVPYGRGVLLRGRLGTGLSAPLGGAPVRVVERFAGGAKPAVRVSTVETGARGEFSLRAAPGPSRTIAVTFDGSRTLSRSAAPALDLKVRSHVLLRASAKTAAVGGAPLVFSGRAVAPPGTIPRPGLAIELQFRLAGLPWSEFRTVETDRAGRFRYAYRFSDDDSRGARFQFRAFVPAQESWPFEPGGSRPALVRGI